MKFLLPRPLVLVMLRIQKMFLVVVGLSLLVLLRNFCSEDHGAHTKRHVSDPEWELLRLQKYVSMDLNDIRDKHQSLPDYYFEHKNLTRNMKVRCAPYPKLSDLCFTNEHFQTLETKDGRFFYTF